MIKAYQQWILGGPVRDGWYQAAVSWFDGQSDQFQPGENYVLVGEFRKYGSGLKVLRSVKVPAWWWGDWVTDIQFGVKT
ncbi:MAG: hypothetical protein HS120_04340 [Burkholderiales bacterium]|nr:hypothetical protein [Burkholderiales bacterium]